MKLLRATVLAALLPAVFLLFSLSGCGLFGTKVSKFAPLGEVRELQTFTLEFDEPIAPQDKQNIWLEDSFLLISPGIPGKYKWITPTTLVFSPAGSLQPAQKYAVRLNSKALAFGGDRKFRNQTFYFNTPDFKALGAEIFWKPIPHTEYKVTAQVNLKFSYRPNLDDLKNHLKVAVNDKPYGDFTVSAGENGVSILLGEIQQGNAAQTVAVTVTEGLKPSFDRTQLADNQDFKLTLPPIVKLVLNNIGSGLEGDYGWLELHTTQPFDPDKLGQYIDIQPRPDSVRFVANENATRVTGRFLPGMEYSVKVRKGAPGLYGGTLETDVQDMVALANLQPSLKFSDKKGMYLLRGGRENIAIEAVNIAKAELRVYEIFRNNILHFFNANYTYSDRYLYDYGDGDEDYYGYAHYEVEGFGRMLYEEKLNFNASDNRRVKTTLNLHKALDTKFKGIYMVQMNSNDDYWLSDAKIVVVSDLGMIAKYTKDECLVFVNSLATAQPVSGVTLRIISTNNQTLAQATTDATGMARFDKLGALTEGFTPRLILAEYGDDFNFLDLKATEIETSRFDVGGKEIAADSYDSFLYGDRNLYRPGETVHLSGIVRDVNIGIVKDVPVNLRITSSTGKMMQQTQHVLNEQGSFETSIPLPDFAQTGVYTAELFTGNDRYITSYKFSVEDFVPDQIRVMLDADQEQVEAGKEVKISINAEYLFGAPCAGNKYEADFRLKHKPFFSKKYKDYDFTDNSATNSDIENELMEGRLDEQGKAILPYTVPSDITASGVIEGGAYVSVFDGTGRTVNRLQSFTAFTRNYFIGIKRNRYYFGTNSNINFDVIALSPKETPLQNLAAEVELVRYEWQTILTENNDRYRYVSEEKQITEWKRKVSLSGSTPVNFMAQKSGRYELRIRKQGEADYTRVQFYVYGFSTANASSFEVDREGRVDIIMDKEVYQPGETAKVLFVTPFTGKMLVTVERDRVMEYFMLDVTNNSTELKLPIRDDASPNAYITATLFRPYREISAIPFMVGHGFQGFQVEKPESHLPVSISAPEKIKPNTTQWVTVKSAPQKDIFVTLAAVDEGILQIKNYKTPDPHAHFYAKRKLGVSSYDLYELVMPEMDGASSTAGGDEYQSGKRQNPVKSKRFKLVALWSGIQRTDANGEVKVKLEIPQFNGEIRLMALAYDGKRFGAADRPMKVADDLILMPEIPRFISQNDQLMIPVNVQNTTKKAGKVTVNMSVSGPMKLASGGSQTIEVPAEGSANAFFEVKTWNEIGEGKISLKTSGLATVSDAIDIPVRPNSPFTVEGTGGELQAGTEVPLAIGGNFVKGTARGSITVAPFPTLRYAKSLRYLLGYPHGCLEQTISKAFPQLYLADLIAASMPDQKVSTAYNVREAIRKVEGLQLYDGSFSYWRGMGEGYDWTTVYAIHFLLEARKAGFEVSNRTLNDGLDYIANMVTRKKVVEETYTVRTPLPKTETRKMASRDNIYGLYVLALAQRADIATMNYYLARTNLLNTDTRYLLAGAFGHAKLWSSYNSLIPKDFEPLKTGAFNSDAFDSELRANAIMLNTMLEVNPSDKQIPTMVNYLAGRVATAYSTQENAWALVALGKAARQVANSNVTTEVVVDGKVVATLPAKGGVYADNSLAGKQVKLRPKGSGTTYYYAYAEGIRSDGAVPIGDNNLMVRRNYYTRDGKQITGNAFGQGDLIVCKLSISGGSRTIEHVANSYVLPSCFDIQNARIRETADLAWVDAAANKLSPNYIDIRDDRLLLYCTAPAQKTQDYYYLIRVVNAGTFSLAAVGAEAMYAPQCYSYHGGGTVKVNRESGGS